jgi:hypothetical protein
MKKTATDRVLRVNTFNPGMAYAQSLTEKINPRVIAGGAVLLPKRQGQAAPPTFTHIKSKDNYVPGMGESTGVGRAVLHDIRAGANDFLKIASRGFSV